MTNIQSISPPVSSLSRVMRSPGARRSFWRWSTGCMALALVACASVAPSTPQEQVTQRANARWKHMVARDFDKAYTYTPPGFRALVSADAYRGRFGAAVVWLDAEVVRVNCPEAAKCEAMVRLEFRSTVGRKEDKASTYIDETWVLEDGQWWKFESIKGN